MGGFYFLASSWVGVLGLWGVDLLEEQIFGALRSKNPQRQDLLGDFGEFRGVF